MKTLTSSAPKVCSLLLGLLLAAAALPATATAATTIQLSATITNTDGVALDGSVCLERVGTNGCEGTNYINGAWSRAWTVDANHPDGDYRILVGSSTMADTSRWYVAADSAGTTDKAQATQVHLGEGAPDLAFTMVMPAIAKLSGRVVDTVGHGVGDLQVGINQGGSIRSTTTTADGTFSFGYTRAGAGTVYTGGGLSPYLQKQVAVTVPESGTSVVPDIVVHQASSIGGQVTDTVTGDPVPFVQVAAYSATTHVQLGIAAQTDVAGHYQISGLGTTPFVLGFIDAAFSGYGRTLNDGGDPIDWSPQTPITLAEGEDRVYDQAMVLTAPTPPPAHTLGGTVTDAGGNPVPGITVTDGDLSDTTDRRGHWYLDSPDGRHTLLLSQDWHWNSLLGSRPGWFVAPTTVTVSGGAGPDDLAATALPAGRVAGTVEGPGGPDDVGAREVWVYDGTGTLLAHDKMTEGTGYAVDVPAGVPVRLLARALTSSEPRTDLMPRWLGDVDSATDSTPVEVGQGVTSTGHDFHLAAGLANLTPPVISGTVAPGRTVTATTGTWSVHTQTTFATTWLRDGVVVGSGPSYVVKAADAGRPLRARVTATNGLTVSQALSAPRGAGRLATTTSVRGRSPKHRTVKLVVTVTAPGLTPDGSVTVRRGTKVVKATVTLVGGRTVVELRRQPTGTKQYTVSYGGSAYTLPSSRSVTVRVR